MAQTKQVVRPVVRPPVPDFDEQLWPVNCTLAIFAGVVAGIVIATSDFETANLLENGWVRLSTVVLVMAGMVVGTVYLQRKRSVRRLQLAVLISLLLHLGGAIELRRHFLTASSPLNDRNSEWIDDTRQIALPDYGREPTNEVSEDEIFQPVSTDSEPLKETAQEPASRQTTAEQPATAAAAGTGEPSQETSTAPANTNSRRVQTSAPRSSDRLSGIKITRQTDTGRAEPTTEVPVDQPTQQAQTAPTTVEARATAARAATTGQTEAAQPQEENPTSLARLTPRNDSRRTTEEPAPQPGEAATAPSRRTVAAAPATTADVDNPSATTARAQSPATVEAAATAARTASVSSAPSATPSETPQTAPAAVAQATSPRRAASNAPVAGQATQRPQRTERPAQAPESRPVTTNVATAQPAADTPLESSATTASRQPQPNAEEVPVRVAQAADASPAAAETTVMQPRRAEAADEPTPQAPATRSSPVARSATAVSGESEAIEGPSLAGAPTRPNPSVDPQPATTAPARRPGHAPAAVATDAAESGEPASARVASQPLQRRTATAQDRASNAPAADAPTRQVARNATGSRSGAAETAAESESMAAGGDGPKHDIEASATAVAGRAAATSPSATAGAPSDAPAVASAAPAEGRTRLGRSPASGTSSPTETVRASSPARSATGGQALAAAPVASPTAATPEANSGGPAQPQPNAQATTALRGGAPSLPATPSGLAQPLPDARAGGASVAVGAAARRTTGSADPSLPPGTASGGQVTRTQRDVTAAMPGAGEGRAPEVAAGGASGEPGLEPQPAAGSAARSVAAAGTASGVATVEAPTGTTNRQPTTGGRRGKQGPAESDQPDTTPNTASRVARNAKGSVASSDTTAAEAVELAAGGGAVSQNADATAATGGRSQSSSSPTGSAAEDPSGDGTAAAGSLAAVGRRGGAKKAADPLAGVSGGGQAPSRTAGVATIAGGAKAEIGVVAAGAQAAPGSPDATAASSSARSQSPGAVAAATGAPGPESIPGSTGAAVAAGRGAARRGDDALAASGGIRAGTPGRANGPDLNSSAAVPGVATELASTKGGTGESPLEAAVPGAGRPRSASQGELIVGSTEGEGQVGPARAAAGGAGTQRRPGGSEQSPVVKGPGGGAQVARSTVGAPVGAIASADDVGPMAAVEEVAHNDQQGPAGGATSRPAPSMPVEIAAADGPGGLSDNPGLRLGLPNRHARPQSESVTISSRRFVLKRSAGQPSVDVHAEAAPAFRQRMPSEREKTARSRGGNAGTEEAVELGLDFLARHQSPDGRWTLDAFSQGRKEKEYENAGAGQMQSDSAATGLALLAFLGAGYTHRDGKYMDVVEGGLAYLISNQKSDGDLFSGGSKYCWLYSHGIASIALCEAYGMTQDPAVREGAQKALDFIASAQDPTLGGWRYGPQIGADTSVSGWQMMALKSGELAGLEVQSSCYPLVVRWLDKAQGANGVPSRYVYRPTAEFKHQREPSRTMTAEALLMRLYTGWQRNNPHLMAGADYLKDNLPDVGTRQSPQRDAYYWYYATQVMFQVGGDHWKTWNDRLHPLLIQGQVKTGPLAGSWDPKGPVPDRWGQEGGRVYLTAMHLMMLEVYYRHLPLYQTLGESPRP